ncbi:MAG: hypothetical protein FGM38_02535 [Solirubrobacterales bacterium]|nr:hypothetical protein [Solirubrobacterales bacterium]
MALSAVLVFGFGRRAYFSGDELSIVSLVGRLEPSELFEPYVGHLVPIPLLAYRAVLDVFGTGEYFAFQAMTLLAIFLLAWFLFLWAKERVPAWVAVAPCLLLTIFPQDILHYLAGNGFTIVFALACGVGALYAFDRRTALGDVAAFILLVLGMMTYTVAVAFAIGVLVAALLDRDRRRAWVAGLPLIAYAIWRLTVASASTEIEDTGPDFVNLLLLPAWTFQSIGGSLAALFGLDFDFSGLAAEDGAATFAAASLAVVFLGYGGVVVARGRAGSGLVVVAAIALALFASQTLVWGTFEARPGPGEDRYLYPGVLAVVLIGLELVRQVGWDRIKVGAVWLVTILSLVGAIGILATSRNRESLAGKARAEVLGVTLLASTEEPPKVADQPRDAIRKSFDPEDGSRFGYLGFTEADLAGGDSEWGETVDAFLAGSLRLKLRPVPDGVVAWRCRPASGPVVTDGDRALLPVRGAILYSERPLELLLGRYGETATVPVGPLGARRAATIRLPRDDGRKRWFLSVAGGSPGTLADLTVCRYRPAPSPAVSSPFPKGPPRPPDQARSVASAPPGGP